MSDKKNFIKSIYKFLIGFAVISLPWWYYNTVTNGSPFSTWAYLNVGLALFKDNWQRWWWKDQADFRNVWEIFRLNPSHYLINVLYNLKEASRLLVVSTGILAPFAVAGVFEYALSSKSKSWLILLGVLSVQCLMVSQAFIPPYGLLGWVPTMVIVGVSFASGFFNRCKERYSVIRRYHLSILIWIVFLIFGLGLLSYEIKLWFRTEDLYGTLADQEKVTTVLKNYDADISKKCIMAINPARAYFVGSKYLATPLYFEGTVEDMVCYRGLSERVKEYAPKYPSNMPLSQLRADYLVSTHGDEWIPFGSYRDLPQLSFLLNPQSQEIPKNFVLVYFSPRVVVYEIKPN